MHYKPTQHNTARNLYFQTELSQAQIAQQVGVNGRTLYRWMNEGQWKKLKAAARHMPAQIVENFRAQLVQMQIDIMSRPPGQNIPTLDETRIMSTLVLSISRMNVQVTQSNSIQVLQNYIEHVDAQDHELALANMPLANTFLTGKGKDGFSPCDLEFDCGTPYYLQQECPTHWGEPEGAAQDLHNPAQLEFNFPPEPIQKKECDTIISNTSPLSGELEGAFGHSRTFQPLPYETPNPAPTATPTPMPPQTEMSGSDKKTIPANSEEYLAELNCKRWEQAKANGLSKPRQLPSDLLRSEAKEKKRQEAILQTLKEMKRDYPGNNKKRQNYW